VSKKKPNIFGDDDLVESVEFKEEGKKVRRPR
jgi:hypothetical protein